MEDMFMIIDQMKGENNITNPKYIHLLSDTVQETSFDKKFEINLFSRSSNADEYKLCIYTRLRNRLIKYNLL